MKGSKWYQEAIIRTSDAFVETSWASVWEPNEDAEERLAIKKGDTPPQLPRRVSNLRVRDDQALNGFFSNPDKMHRATSNDPYTQAWFDYTRLSVFPLTVRRKGKDVELFNVSTYQYSFIFNNIGSFNRKSEFRKPENLNKTITKGEKFNIAELSLLKEFWGHNYTHVILTAEADSCRQTQGSCLRTMAW